MRYARLVLLGLVAALAALLIAAPTGRADEPPEPDMSGEVVLVPPPPPPPEPGVGDAPSPDQTSEFMAGSVVASVVFVESSGGSGNCSPADPQTENWSAARQTQVLNEISAGLAFWTSRANGPVRSFQLDNWGSQPTSCEPITRQSGDRLDWIPDVLTAMGYSGGDLSGSRSFADSRRDALGADWGFVIFVVDSYNDTDGKFTNGYFALAYLNGPYMVMTYDNDGWGINNMNLVTAHEIGHIFGAADEYAGSGCSPAHTRGYLNEANTSCNNGGITSDISIMGEYGEQINPNVDVSTSARNAIGWRNPATGDGGRVVVDVVRTGGAFLYPYMPDPTSDITPTYSGHAWDGAYPPGGENSNGMDHYPVGISKVERAEWKVDGGAYTTATANDGAFDEVFELYTFTPSPMAYGTHTFYARSVNNFGHLSSPDSDTLTIAPDSDGDAVVDPLDNCPNWYNPGQDLPPWPVPADDPDCDGSSGYEEGFVGTDATDACPDDLDDDAWPVDMAAAEGYGKHDRAVNILDMVQLTAPYFNTSPPDPNYSERRDLNGDGSINILDVVRLGPPMFNQTCTP